MRLILLLVVTVPTWAAAEGEWGEVINPAIAERMAAQSVALECADAMAAALSAVAPYDSVAPGLGAIELDSDHSVLVYWRTGSTVPNWVVEKGQEACGNRGVKLVFRESQFSMVELLAVREALFLQLESDSGWALLGLQDGARGLRVELNVETDTSFAIAMAEAANGELESMAGTSNGFVDVTQGGPYAFASRALDRSPFWSGAHLAGPGGVPHCTTGFAAGRVFGRLMLTAAHCTVVDAVTMTNGADLTPIGISAGHSGVNLSFDTSRVEIAPGSNAGLMYDGPFGNEFIRPVRGSGGSFVGMLVCTSGAFSGARCNIAVSSLNTRIQTVTGERVEGLVVANQLDDEAAVGQKDSGGPVFTLQQDLIGIKARGIISSQATGSLVRPCAGEAGRVCSARVLYVEIANATRLNDAWLELQP